MFFNLAWRNSKRNRSENLIYFLTMVTAVATFYIVLSLGSQDVMRFLEEIESDAVNRLLTMLMPTVYLFSLLFVFFLVIFANKYQLECRSRELGLYLMFGMTKRHLFIQIMAEGLITSLLALLGGLICGGFLSEVISLATARLVGRGIIAHQSSFSVSAVLLTTLGFLMIQVVALFILCGRLFNKEIHQLLYGEMAKKQQVGKMSGNLFSLILGAVVLTLAYWVILKYFMVAGGMMIIVAVILGIVGTMLFIRGLAGLLSAAAASVKRNTTHGLYIFTLRQLHENIVHKPAASLIISWLIILGVYLLLRLVFVIFGFHLAPVVLGGCLAVLPYIAGAFYLFKTPAAHRVGGCVLGILLPSIVEKLVLYFFGASLYGIPLADVSGVMSRIAANEPFTHIFSNPAARYILNLSFFGWQYIVGSIVVCAILILGMMGIQKRKSCSRT